MVHADIHPSKPASLREDAVEAVRRLRAAGHEAYFAGGCVRDELLGLAAADFDIATSAPPAEVRKIFPRTQAVGVAFGVILVKLGQSTIEVATFRTEGVYEDGRRPVSVRFASAQEDAQRRDFTINGLFFDPIENRVMDYVGGQADLAAKCLRAIGNPAERFREDHLRLLRAVRFAARFGFAIEPTTAAAIRKDAPLLKRISPERIADELRRMLTTAARNAAWRMLWDFGLIHTICRGLSSTEAAEPAGLDESRCPVFHLAGGQDAIPFALAIAAGVLSYRLHAKAAPAELRTLLQHAEVQAAIRAMRHSLRLSNDESAAMQEILASAGTLLADPEPRLATLKRFMAKPTADLTRQLLDSLAAISHHRDRVGWLTPRLAALEGEEVAPVPLVTGDDLTTAGLHPGPQFKGILEAVYDAQLESTVTDKASAMKMAMELAK